MEEWQRRILAGVPAQIDAFEAGHVTLRQLVDNLAGLLDAAEPPNSELVEEFWELWGGLETHLALENDPLSPTPHRAALIDDLAGLREWAAGLAH